ncbi:class I SAM-dependent methyltransferase [Halalkalibacillus halophilus]|uniref:class I SAM-dependent methyltransferase n=1 Tax=Halalkalibacillus halophilus TaxID=392827 RepID=UPI000404E954|nr:class I SAM-dependent methyltransferase [Halalkalibacillus halophilus]
MLSNKGFDLWANEYDRSVQLSEESDSYPFAGYKDILNTIYNEAMRHSDSRILDLGFGTAVLTSQLYKQGHQIFGVDFSKEMLAIAQEKMPQAILYQADLTEGVPQNLAEQAYDTIISTYALHHLDDQAKVNLIKRLMSMLRKNGKLLIGDVAFETRAKHDACKLENAHHWDEEEYYFVYEELQPSLQAFCASEFYPISHCGGVIELQKFEAEADVTDKAI